MTHDSSQSDSRLTRRRQGAFALIAVVCILLAGAAVVTAQDQVQQSDDFEDGNIDGWTGEVSLSELSTNGNYSIHQSDSDVSDFLDDSGVWEAGPELDLTEEWNVSGTSRQVNGADTQGGVRVGLVDDETGQTIALQYGRLNTGQIKLYWNQQDGGSVVSPDQIPSSYDGDWVNFEMSSPEDEQTVYAKVWQVGSSEPSDPQLELEFDGDFGGEIAIQSGEQSNGREVWLDDVELEGQEVVTSDEIRLDLPKYLQHNDSSHYAVEANESGTWVDVTDESTVTPNNTDALTFYPDNQTVVAGGNKSINERVGVLAEYEDLNQTGSVVVATTTVDNLDLLPAWWSVNSLLSDWTVIWILMATLIATAATRMATTFAGIGAFVMAMVMGWIMGDVPNGIMVATIFMGIFIGLNLAANIDYSVR